jgi:hypothetical protein
MKTIYDFLLMLDQTGIAYALFILVAVYFWTKSNKATTELYTIKRELLKLKAVL